MIKVYYVSVKFNKDSYNLYDYMTIDETLNVGDSVVVQPGKIAYVSHYTIERADLRGRYKWVLGAVDCTKMTVDLYYKLYDGGINHNTGRPFKTKFWSQEIEDTGKPSKKKLWRDIL